MTNHLRKFTRDEVKVAFEEGRFEELATWGIEKESIEWQQKSASPVYSVTSTTYKITQ
jgi:hypothetical protein